MKTLTKQQVKELNNILYHAKRAHKFIQDQQTVICSKKIMASNDAYINKDGVRLLELNKYVGSDLTGLEMSVNFLENFIQAN